MNEDRFNFENFMNEYFRKSKKGIEYDLDRYVDRWRANSTTKLTIDSLYRAFVTTVGYTQEEWDKNGIKECTVLILKDLIRK